MDYLNVCYVQSVWSPSKRRNTVYFMSLLAHAAVQGNHSMVYELIKHGASKKFNLLMIKLLSFVSILDVL